MTERLGQLQEKEREYQARVKANSDMIKEREAKIASLLPQIKIEQEINLLFGLDTFEVISCPGE